MNLEGTVLDGKYKVLARIGVGGMGTVYDAEHVHIHRRVAVKVLQAEFAQNVDAVARFRREAQIAGSLGHDNICDVLDVGVTAEGSHYLVMPLLRGSSLADLLSRSGTLPAPRALDLIAQFLDALSAAHQAGVVHRDLKPENVFVTRVGDREDFVKVLDFGISKIVSTGGALPSSMTRTGTVMGTPYYMSPEQARGQKDQDHRVDVYACGVMLYELVTGRRPYDGDTFNELIIKIVTEPFVPASTLVPGLPPAVEAIIARAMTRNRDERYPDAPAMRAEVLAARSALGTGTLTGGAVAPARVDVRTPPPLLRTPPPSDASTSTHEPERRASKAAVFGIAAGVLVVAGGLVGVFAFAGGDEEAAPPVTAAPFVMTPPPMTAAPPPATTAPATAMAVGEAPPAPETAEPATAAESSIRRRRRTTGTATTATTPATTAPETTRRLIVDNPAVIRGRGGAQIVTENE